MIIIEREASHKAGPLSSPFFKTKKIGGKKCSIRKMQKHKNSVGYQKLKKKVGTKTRTMEQKKRKVKVCVM